MSRLLVRELDFSPSDLSFAFHFSQLPMLVTLLKQPRFKLEFRLSWLRISDQFNNIHTRMVALPMPSPISLNSMTTLLASLCHYCSILTINYNSDCNSNLYCPQQPCQLSLLSFSCISAIIADQFCVGSSLSSLIANQEWSRSALLQEKLIGGAIGGAGFASVEQSVEQVSHRWSNRWSRLHIGLSRGV